MPMNGMQIGSDLTLTVVDSVMGLQTFANITMVDVKQQTKNLRSVPLSGPPLEAEVPDGWNIEIAIDAGNSALLDYVLANEATFYAGGDVGTITGSATIIFPNGVSRLVRFTGGAIKLTDGGSFKGQEKVSQRASIKFTRGIAAT
jgi:hypothetical protein